MTDIPIETRFVSLEASVRSLSADVQALTETLRVVNQLQLDQEAQRRATVENARKLAQVEEATTARAERAQVVARRVAFGFAILLPIASILVYFVLFEQLTGLLNQNRNDRLKSCASRNDAAISNMNRENALAAVEDNPAVAEIHRRSARELKATIVDCEKTIRLVGYP